MFNKLKYPARGDLPIRGVEFVEGTGAAHLCPAPGVICIRLSVMCDDASC